MRGKTLSSTRRAATSPYTFQEPIYLRMGVHAGDILIEDQDGFATLGRCLSAVVYDQIEEKFAC